VGPGMAAPPFLTRPDPPCPTPLDPPSPKRWSTIGSGSLVIYTQTPVDLEERQLLLSGDSHTVQSLLDTLTCNCMQ
jgi:hypothetical protein